jgi:iturin family lipopeptide synthetase A
MNPRAPMNVPIKGRVIARESPNCSMLATPTATESQPRPLEWTGSVVAHPDEMSCLHHLIEEQVRRTPHEVALVFEEQRLTYDDLNRRAQKLALHLSSIGAGPDVLVGLLLDRSIEVVVGVLGILKAGAAYLPIDAAYPEDRIAFMLVDAKAKLLVTQTSLLHKLEARAAKAVCLDSFDWSALPNTVQDSASCLPENLAYVIYTSGSTGRPKGVGIEHRNIVNYVLGVSKTLQLEPKMNHATVSTIAADLGNTVIFPALTTGGCLHVISQKRAESQPLLAEYFQRERIDVLKIVPSHLAALQDGKSPEKVMPRKRLILGGEASRLDWIEKLRALSPGCEIYNHYGPTETTVGVLTYHVEKELPATRSGTLPLGRPLPNSRVYILDENGKSAPVGIEGELYIGGAGVTRGYLNRPDLTSEKFVSDPFGKDAEARMYRTGDLARWLPDGSIEFCGRIDDQVKIHGYRIELGEIAEALREQNGVKDAIVMAVDDGSGNKQLVAYVIPKRARQPLWGRRNLYWLPDGSPVVHLNTNSTDSRFNEIFVRQEYVQHGITIHDGACIVDASADIGLFAVFASRLARNVKLFCFESDPAAFACLKTNAEAWSAAAQCLPYGLAHETKSAEDAFFEALSGSSDLSDDIEELKHSGSDRQSESLDAMLSGQIGQSSNVSPDNSQPLLVILQAHGISQVDLFKIDIKEGLEILEELTAQEWSMISNIVVRVRSREHLESVTALLVQHQYKVLAESSSFSGETQTSYVYAIRPADGVSARISEKTVTVPLHSLASLDDEILTPVALRNNLKKRLPQYMIPVAFVLMEKFPLTANGKLDRKAFPAITHETPQLSPDFISPRTKVEKTLAKIWMDLMKIEQIGINDDFFELGARSLMAVRAVSQIREKFGVDLPLATLLQTPTIASLATKLGDQQWVPSWSLLVPMRPEGTRPPLFLFHAHGGNIIEYHALVQHLEKDQPVYAFQAKGLNGEPVESTSVERMASAFVEELKQFQAEGPYFLAGFCLGGLLALEVAQQLTEQGKEVALVAMIQSIAPEARRFKPSVLGPQRWWYRAKKRISVEMDNLAYGGRAYFVQRSRDVLERSLMRTKIKLDRMMGNRPRDPSRLSRLYIFESLGMAHKKAMDAYKARPYDGNAVVFRASKQLSGLMVDEWLGWRPLLRGNFEICEVPGHQQNLMLEPNVQRVATELSARLKAVQQKHRDNL